MEPTISELDDAEETYEAMQTCLITLLICSMQVLDHEIFLCIEEAYIYENVLSWNTRECPLKSFNVQNLHAPESD